MSDRQRQLTAVFDAGPTAHLSHLAAAWLWGVAGGRRRPVITRTLDGPPVTSGAFVHRVRLLPDAWTTVLDGIPVVRPELMLLGVCATEPLGRAARILDNAWSRRLLSGPSLQALLDDLGRRGRNGVAMLRELLDERGDDYVPPASNLESRVKSLLDGAGLGTFARQVDVGEQQWSGRVDFVSTRWPLVVEVQSELHHTALTDVVADAARRAWIERDGFVVVEITDDEVWTDPSVALDRIRNALRSVQESRRQGNGIRGQNG